MNVLNLQVELRVQTLTRYQGKPVSVKEFQNNPIFATYPSFAELTQRRSEFILGLPDIGSDYYDMIVDENGIHFEADDIENWAGLF